LCTSALNVFSDKLPPETETTSAKTPAMGEFHWQDYCQRSELVARSLVLESDCRLCNLRCHAPDRDSPFGPLGSTLPRTKKADVAEHPKAFDHVGLLVNEPPDRWGCSLSSRPTILN
jgi:hypothetical protein